MKNTEEQKKKQEKQSGKRKMRALGNLLLQ